MNTHIWILLTVSVCFLYSSSRLCSCTEHILCGRMDRISARKKPLSCRTCSLCCSVNRWPQLRGPPAADRRPHRKHAEDFLSVFRRRRSGRHGTVRSTNTPTVFVRQRPSISVTWSDQLIRLLMCSQRQILNCTEASVCVCVCGCRRRRC